MIEASHHGATPDYGCIEAVVRQSDGSYLQHFSNSDAFLLGSNAGTGVVNDSVAAKLPSGRTPGQELSANIGGQPLDLVPCFDDHGDFQPFISPGSRVTALYGRAVTSEVPIEIDPQIIPAFAAEIEVDHVVLAPVGPSIALGGNALQQSFEDPLTGDTTTLTNQQPGSALTVDQLWGACNLGNGPPPWYVMSELVP